MNERIKQLADQAEDYATAEYEKWIPTPDFSGIPNIRKIFNEKFAKLIISECARIARATPCPYEEDEVRQRLGHTWDMASLEAGREIVEHFGVEE